MTSFGFQVLFLFSHSLSLSFMEIALASLSQDLSPVVGSGVHVTAA